MQNSKNKTSRAHRVPHQIARPMAVATRRALGGISVGKKDEMAINCGKFSQFGGRGVLSTPLILLVFCRQTIEATVLTTVSRG